jgi:hypothetical protein
MNDIPPQTASTSSRRGAISWTSPDPSLRCAIATVNVPPLVRMDLYRWMGKEKKIRIRGAEPNKLRWATPYYLSRQDINRFWTPLTSIGRQRASRELTTFRPLLGRTSIDTGKS